MHIIAMQPIGESVDRLHLQTMEELTRAMQAAEDVKYQVVRAAGSSLLEHTRCELATRFYQDTDADVLLWVDSDMVIRDPEAVLQMCREAHERQGIVGALSMVKRPLGSLNALFMPDQGSIRCFSQGEVYAIQNIGTGLCAVSRAVLKAVIENSEADLVSLQSGACVWTFYRSMVVEGAWWGEDMSFCLRARRSQMPVFVDTRVRVGHRGPYDFNLEDSGQAIELKDGLVIHLKTRAEAEAAE